MLGAVTCDTAGTNLAAIRDVLTQGWNIFVIDGLRVFPTERTNFLLKFLNWWLCHCGAP